MKITITIDDKYQPAFARRATEEETREVIAGRIVAEQMERYLTIDSDDAKSALAGNAALMEIGIAVNAAPPEKQAAAIAAAQAALDS